MSKIKEGDRVRVVAQAYFHDRHPDIMAGKTFIVRARIATGPYPWKLSPRPKNCLNAWADDELELVNQEKTMDNLKAGDILENDELQYKKAILGILSDAGKDVVVTKDLDDGILAAEFLADLEDLGWHIAGPVVEMTVAEIAEKLGHEVKIVKE